MTVVMCDTNSDIASQGSIPVTNTMWRASAMSYLPYVDYCCPSGEQPTDSEEINKHRLYKYRVLRPDFVHVDSGHFHLAAVLDRCAQVGVVPIQNQRIASYLPEFGNPRAAEVDNPISSSNLREGRVNCEMSMSSAIYEMMAKKMIRDMYYGSRDWFSSKYFLVPDRSRNLMPREVSALSVVSSENEGDGTINVPRMITTPGEVVLHKAFKERGM